MAKTVFNIIQSDVVGGGMENIFLEYSQILNNTISHHACASHAPKNQRFLGYQCPIKDENWYNHQKQSDINLVCIVSKKFCHLKILKEQNIKVEFLNIRGHFDIFAAIKLNFLIKKYSPKLIISHNGRAFSAINLSQKIFSGKNYQTLAISHGGSIKRILGFDYIIAVAKHIEEKIINSNFKGVVKTIYNGYKVCPFTKNNQQKNNFVFGTLSRLSKEKNLAEALRMFKKFNNEVEKNSLLIIAGGDVKGDAKEDKEKANLEQIVKEYNLGEKVKFIGWIKNKEEFFNQIDVFLQPALSESFGMTILEAFNYQTPIIACNSFGPKEIIKNDYSGYLFDPDNKESLFLAMRKSYLQKEQLGIIIQNANHELREKFSYEIMEKQLLNFVKEIIR